MNNQKPSANKPDIGKYAYYSGIGFQMLVIIAVFTYIGYRIDQSRDADTPIFTALLSLLGVCLSIYNVIRAVTRKKRSDGN